MIIETSYETELKKEIEKLQEEVNLIKIDNEKEGGDFLYSCEEELIEKKAELKGLQEGKAEGQTRLELAEREITDLQNAKDELQQRIKQISEGLK